MRRTLFVISLLLLVAPLAAPRPVVAQEVNLISVWKSFEAATNVADVNAAADMFADDATFIDTHPSPGLSGVWRGRDQIRELFKGAFQSGQRQESSDFLIGAAGNNEQLTVNDVRQWFAPGVDLPPGFPLPIESHFHLIIQVGKIKTLIVDNKPEWLAKAGAQGHGPGTPAPEPLAVWQAFVAAANKPDPDALTALFADDGVLADTHPSPGLSGVWQGKDQLRDFFRASSNPGDRWESSGFLLGAGGNEEQLTVSDVRDWVAPGPNLPPGLPMPVESRFHLVVHDGKIAVLVMDNTSEWLARAGALGHAPTTVGMPRTGTGDNEAWYLWLLGLSGAAIVCGSYLSRRANRQKL